MIEITLGITLLAYVLIRLFVKEDSEGLPTIGREYPLGMKAAILSDRHLKIDYWILSSHDFEDNHFNAIYEYQHELEYRGIKYD